MCAFTYECFVGWFAGRAADDWCVYKIVLLPNTEATGHVRKSKGCLVVLILLLSCERLWLVEKAKG